MAKEDFSDFAVAGGESFDDFKPAKPIAPTRTLGDYGLDALGAVLKIGPTALKGVGDIAQMATAGRVGGDLSNSMKSGMDWFENNIQSDAMRAAKGNINQTLKDPNQGVGDVLRSLYQNPSAVADMGVSTIGSMLLPMGAVGAASKLARGGIGAGTATGITVGTGAAQNAAETFSEVKGDLRQKYTGAAASGVSSAVLGKLLGGGLEGQIARRMVGQPSALAGARGAGIAISKEAGQEFGEEFNNVLAKNFGEGALPDWNSAAKQGTLGGVLGGLMSGPVSISESLGNMKDQTRTENDAPVYRPATPMTDAKNVAHYDRGTQTKADFPAQNPQQTPKAALLALGYDPEAVAALPDVMVAGYGPKAQAAPLDMAEQAAIERQAQQKAEIGLTPDVEAAIERRARNQAAQAADSAPTAAQAEPALLQRLRQAGWTPPQEVYDKTPAPAPEQQAEIVQGMGQDAERLYQQDVKDGIKERMGLTPAPEPKADKPASYADSPFLKQFAEQGGIEIAERGDTGIDGKRLVAGNRAMPNPYNIGGQPLYRKGGMRGDMLVQSLVSQGYLTQQQVDAADAGGVGGSEQLAYDLIRQELTNPGSVRQADDFSGVAQRFDDRARTDLYDQAQRMGVDTLGLTDQQVNNAVNRAERRTSTPDTGTFAERKAQRIAQKAQGLAQDFNYDANEALLDAPPNMSTEDAMRTLGFTEQEIQDAIAKESNAAPKNGPSDSATVEGNATGQARDTPTGAQDQAQASPSAASEGLSSPTKADVIAQQDRAAAAQKLESQAKQDADKAAKDADERKRIAKASEAAAATFELGGNALDNLTGQKDIFSEPAAQATDILNAANVTGKERIDVLKDVKAGTITPDELKAAYPAKEMTQAPSAKIEDSGAVLEGARKMYAKALDTNTAPAKAILANYRHLQGGHSSSQAKADAEAMLGIDSPVSVLPKADYDLAAQGVPMWYDLDDQKIYYNTAFKDRDRARDAQWMTEEILHAVDHVGGGKTISLSSGRFNAGGDIRAEIEGAHKRSQVVKEALNYPLVLTGITDDRKAVELFARIGVLFKGYPDALKAAAPTTYEVYRGLFDKLSGVSDKIQQPNASTADENAVRLGADGNGRATDGQSRGAKPTDNRLERIRDAVVESVEGSRDGRSGDFGSSRLEARANQAWDVPDPTPLDKITRYFQNNRIDIRKTVDSIKATGKAVSDNANTYLRDELHIGRVRAGLDKLADQSITPLLRAVANSGIEVDAVNRYLWARHAEERNQQMAKVNNVPFTPALDLAGMSSTTARAELATIHAGKDAAKFRRIAAMVDGITKDTRNTVVNEGLEDAATIKAWEGAYKAYVPLQRDIEQEAVARGAGYTVRGSESRRAVGSSKEATNILANVIAQAENAIVRSEKAKVGRSVLKLAEQNPNSDFWTVDTPPTERAIDPRTGLATQRVIADFKSRDNVFVVKENGKERYVVFNESHPRAVEFARNLKNLDAGQLDVFTEAVSKGTRYLSMWVTSRNPLFWLTNFARDVQGVAFNLQNTPLAGQALQIMAKVPQALGGTARSELGKAGGKWTALAQEFEQSGGQTGYMQMYASALDRMNDISKEVDQMRQKVYDPRKLGRGLLEVIDGANNVIENGVRLAVYAQAREEGLSIDQSASIAKNITVNFNRKGNASSAINAFYMFANANIQGNVRMIQALATSKRAQVLAAGMVAAGAALTALNMAICGDDEKSRRKRFSLVPEHERERNWILFMPESDTYVKVPLPLGPHILFNAGRVVAELGLEKDASPLEKSMSFMSSFFGAFNPIGGGLPSADTKGLAQLATPSIVRPLTDLAVNQNFAGTNIARESMAFGGYDKPAYTRAKENTPEHWKATAKALNDWTGGDKVKAGAVNLTPEQIAYALKSYIIPGIAPSLDKAAAQATGRKDVKVADMPGVSKFVGQIDENERASAAYKTARADQQRVGEYKAYVASGDREKALATLKEWGGGDIKNGRKLLAEATSYDRIMTDLRKQRKQAALIQDEAARNTRLGRLDERVARTHAVYLSNTHDLRSSSADE